MIDYTNRQRWALFFCLLTTFLLQDCNPAPRYAKPLMQTPVAYKESVPAEFKESQGWKIATPGDDRIRGNWWEIYGDPQLNALEEQVKISNQSIAVAEANFRQARALVVSARSALFPVIGGSAAYTNSRFSSATRGSRAAGSSGSSAGVSGNSSTGVLSDFSLPVSVSYTFDMWHRVRNTVAANAFQAQATAADVATALLSTQAELATDYFEVRALDRERQVLNETVASYRQALELTTSLFKAGIASDETVSQARTQLDAAIAQATDLGVSRAQFEHAAAVLIGRPPSNFSLSTAALNSALPPVPVGVPSTLLERRPDIAAAERRVAAANAQIGVARAAYYPNITLGATAGFESSGIARWFDWPSRFWSLGPQIGETLFDGGARRALNEDAQAAYDGAVASYRQAVLTEFQAVEDNLAALRILAQEVVEQRATIDSAQHTLDLSLSRFKFGVDSYLNVITSQTAVLTNREVEVQLVLRQMMASVRLILALGGGWDPSQLPQMKDLLAKQPKGNNEAPTQAAPVAATGTPNPPPLPAVNP